MMGRILNFLGGLCIGVGAIYLMDPDRGPRRRALIRDKAVKAAHDTQDFLGKAGRDLGNRVRGTLAQTKGALSADAPDSVLRGATPPGEPAESAQAKWTPGLRLIAGMAGAAAMGFVIARRKPTVSAPTRFSAPGGPLRSPRHGRYL